MVEAAKHPTLVIIPTYEEAGNIEIVISRILALNVSALEILIVDDNSPDGTGELVEMEPAKRHARYRLRWKPPR